MPTSTLKEAMSCIERGCWCGDISQIVGETCHDHAYRAFQGSLDAAKALHEALLPGWFVDIRWWTAMNGGAIAEVGNSHNGKSENPARAWLIAILRAVESGR